MDKPYEPKEGDKIDYKMPGEEYFRPAKIKAIKKMDKKLTISAEYFDDTGKAQLGQATFPGEDMGKCGEKLTRRTDCAEKS